MTNETTASQPMQELVRDLYNFEGGRHFALRLEKMLASQPKSIGDDARNEIRAAVWEGLKGLYYCGRVWCAWQVGTMGQDDFTPAEDMDEVIDPIVDGVVAALEKSRAPAAQASATIQAAPDEAEIRNAALEEAAKMLLNGSFLHDKAPPKIFADQAAKAIREMKRAATIQEPVMVAEPVEKVLQWAALNLNGDIVYQHASRENVAKNCPYIKTPTRIVGLVEAKRAAPMVAEPAGVAEMESKVRRALTKHLGWLGSDEWHDEVKAIGAELAATVKAVPSEALLPNTRAWVDAEQARLDTNRAYNAAIEAANKFEWPGPDTNTEYQCLNDAQNKAYRAKFPMFDELVQFFAAPLADKTDGGE